ncbi:hypothetical protein ACA910_002613 [Epithemia clementina (nom. ined.)]
MSLSQLSDKDSNETVCHILPCSIEYTGGVDGRHLQPIRVDDKVEAVTLRGRGLLAQAPAFPIPPEIATGHVFQVTEQHQQQQAESTLLNDLPSLRFSSMQEWHHEHIPTAVSLKSSKLKDALEWCSVANALHVPLPVTKDP